MTVTSTGATGQAFWMNLPDGWSVLDLDSKQAPAQVRVLMDEAEQRDGSFAQYRAPLEKQLVMMIRSARSSDVSFAAILATRADGGLPVAGSISVSLHDAPEAADADRILSEIDHEEGRSNSVIELPHVGRVVRSAYLQKLNPSGQQSNPSGQQSNAETAVFQYFIPVPDGRRIAVVTCVTPTLPLLELFGDLYDAILSTFQFISALN
ncbi:MAG: hypothetical protein M3Y42_14170 [Actinomycetota bacterium]|nr:hypothetical protein [Actinomycetota bacterium]MDQ2958097.1 hypothetical protein [Actinomycetota bacterium]